MTQARNRGPEDPREPDERAADEAAAEREAADAAGDAPTPADETGPAEEPPTSEVAAGASEATARASRRRGRGAPVKPVVPAATGVKVAQEELPWIDDRASRYWVPGFVALFVGIFVYIALFSGEGVFGPDRTPRPTDTPGPTVSLSPSPEGSPSPSPSGSPSASPSRSPSASPSGSPSASPSASPSPTSGFPSPTGS